MPLSSQDYVEVLRHLQQEVQGRDPEAHALAAQYSEGSNDPRRYLLDYLRSLIKILSERSSGAHGRVLNLINESVRVPGGGPIEGIRLELTPAERELYQREQIDLALLPDREAVVEALLVFYRELLADDGEPGSDQ